jgi:hypothetical protein
MELWLLTTYKLELEEVDERALDESMNGHSGWGRWAVWAVDERGLVLGSRSL